MLAPTSSLSGPHAGIRRAVSTLLLSVATTSAAQTFPYVPTTVLLPELSTSEQNNVSIAYVFRPSDGDAAVELLYLNLTATVDNDAKLESLSSDLPFLKDATPSTVFLPTVADNGTILVQVGDCDSDKGHTVWSYTSSMLASSAEAGSDTWTKNEVSLPSNGGSSYGPNFLGSAFSYSSTLAPVMSEPVLYSYGGMCSTPSTEASTWQSAGTYSKQMMRLSPDDEGRYTASVFSGRGPAFAEAGFTFTPLSTTMTNISDTLTQQKSYVLLGGHTDSAFINMSTAAVWSLPEESWAFLSINGPSEGREGSELTVKDDAAKTSPTSVDSRSGHTVVLNEEGNALVVLGGWVGSVSQPAEPQLAILNIGSSFGDWTWSIPKAQPDGSGIYGHGAALLPGNVMMIYGGYDISKSTDKTKRQNNGGAPRFLNLTSMSWGTSYTNPNYDPAGQPSAGAGDTSQSHSEYLKRIGLGVGLGVGTAAVIGAIIVCILYRRRLKKRRNRDDAVRDLVQDGNRFLPHHNEMTEVDDPWTTNAWYTGGHDPYNNGAHSLGYQTLRESRNSLGGYGDSSSPLSVSIPRKPVISRAARGTYQPAGSGASPGYIHPIYEADEEDPHDAALMRDLDMGPATPTTPTHTDPFATPTAGTTASATAPPILFEANRAAMTPSPERMRSVDPEVQDWQTDVDAAEAMLAQMPARSRTSASAGRISPTRRASMRSARSYTPGIMGDDERTASGLSDSNRSIISSHISSHISRVNEGAGKTHASYSSAAGGSGMAPVGGNIATAAVNSDGRLGTSESGSSSNKTFSTAKSTFNALQAEGPSLLLGGERQDRRPMSYPNHDGEDDYFLPPSPSKTKPRRQRGWLGSIRRVFSISGTPNANRGLDDYSPASISPIRRSSLDGLDDPSNSYESRLLGLGGAELLRRKQGRRAWDDEDERHAEQRQPSDRSDPQRPKTGEGDEDEWDIDRAIEKRLVQFMFTVPKDRLRVVNGDENASLYQEDEAVLAGAADKADFASSSWDAGLKALVSDDGVSLMTSAPSPEPLRIHKKKSGESQVSRLSDAPGVETAYVRGPPMPPAFMPTPPASTEPLAKTESYDPWLPVGGRSLRRPSPTSSHGRLSPGLGGGGAGGEYLTDDAASITISEPRPSLTLRTAEEVRFARPRTRVLQMVQSFESIGQETSPARSPRSAKGG